MSTTNNRQIATPTSRLARTRHAGDMRDPNTAYSEDEDDRPQIPHEEAQERTAAMRFLANHEQLVWMSEQRNESLLQTRLYYEAKAAGVKDEDINVDYAVDFSPEAARDPTKGRSPAGKARVRVASGIKDGQGARRDKDRERARRSGGSAR